MSLGHLNATTATATSLSSGRSWARRLRGYLPSCPASLAPRKEGRLGSGLAAEPSRRRIQVHWAFLEHAGSHRHEPHVKQPPHKEGRWRSRAAVCWGSFPGRVHTGPQADVAPFSDPAPAGPVFQCSIRKTIPVSLDCFCPSCLHPAFL